MTPETDPPQENEFRVEGTPNGNMMVSCDRYHSPLEISKEFGGEWDLCSGGPNPFKRKEDGRWVWRLRRAG